MTTLPPTMATISVAVVGAGGRMGVEALRTLNSTEGYELVAAIARSDAGRPAREVAGPSAPDLILDGSLGEALKSRSVDVVVDLSHRSAVLANAEMAISAGANLVIGCTGMNEDELVAIERLCLANDRGAIYAPNFAIGAVLMMHFAAQAARWMPDAEILEMHHERKEDAPSGTALHTAELIGQSRVAEQTNMPQPFLKLPGARGAETQGVHIHSIRLPGLLAHQQVMFGAPGEVLTIRHDAMDRSVYMGGLKLCVRRVIDLKGLVVGLDKILFES